MKQLLKFFICITLWVSSSLGSGQTNVVTLPSGLGDIQLGIGLGDFFREKKEAKRFDLSGKRADVSSTAAEQLLYEKLSTDPFFGHAFYHFHASRLQTIVLVGEVKRNEWAVRQNEFLARCIGWWGSPSELLVVELDEGKGTSFSPALVWRTNDRLIAAAFTGELAEGRAKGTLHLKLHANPKADMSLLFQIPGIGERKREELLKPLRIQLEHLTAGNK